jgi:hypothetical protein
MDYFYRVYLRALGCANGRVQTARLSHEYRRQDS